MRKRLITIAVAATSLLIAASAATAGGWKSGSSISLVQPVAAITTHGPHYGDQVAFAVTTTATDRPYVVLNCYQDGTWVSTGQAFFTPATTFTLASGWWTAGAADCTATLGMLNADGTRMRELASTSFHVEP